MEALSTDEYESMARDVVAVPTIGSTQDIMLPQQAPADTSTLFLQGDVDAAATQEPWGVFLENQANASILLDEEEFAWGRRALQYRTEHALTRPMHVVRQATTTIDTFIEIGVARPRRTNEKSIRPEINQKNPPDPHISVPLQSCPPACRMNCVRR